MSVCSWLHSLKGWSLRDSRGGSYIQFGLGIQPQADETTRAPDVVLKAISVSVRAVHYFAVLAGLGGGLFWTLVLSGRAHPATDTQRRSLRWLVWTAACSGGWLVGLNGALIDGGGLAALLSARAWAIGAGTTTLLASSVVLLGGLCTLAGLLQQQSAIGRALLLAGALLAALSLAVTGHAATAPPRWLGAPLVFLHGLAAAFWVGALWPLAVMLRDDASVQTQDSVRRFSRMAVIGVTLLLATGTGISVLQSVASVTAITQTDYGALWLAKLLMVALLLGMAAFNRFIATPALHTGAIHAFHRLRRSVLLEIALVCTVLALTSGFALTPPPRTLPPFATLAPPANPSSGYSTLVSTDGWTAIADILPARVGDNQIRVVLTDAHGQAQTVHLVSEWSQTDDVATSAPIIVIHDQHMSGHVTLPAPGRWRVRLRRDDAGGIAHSVRLTIPIAGESSDVPSTTAD